MNAKKQNITALLICAAGIGINLLLGYIVSILGLPLYLDTVGTVIVAVAGGYLPGVTVGFITNILKSISDPSAMYYGVFNVMIAITATRLANRGWMKKIQGILGCIVIFALIGGGLGSVIPYFMEDQSYDSASLVGILYGTGYFSSGVSGFLSSLIMDLPDKAITVFLALVILRIIPQKYYSCFAFRGWMQRPLSVADTVGTRRIKTRFMSLQTKVLLVISTSLLTVAVFGSMISMAVYRKAIIKEHTRLAEGTASIAASVLDGDRIDEYLRDGENAAGYIHTKTLLTEIFNSSTDIAFLYVYKIEEDGCHVVFDIDTDEVEADSVGAVIPFDEAFLPYVPELLNGEEVEPVFSDDRFGTLLTAYKPVYDSEGRCACYAGADVDIHQLKSMEHSFLMELITIFFNFFIVVSILVVWLAEYHIIFPVNAMTMCVDDFSKTGGTQTGMDDDVKKIRELDIHTGDEIEKLYNSICGMTLDQTEQMRNIRRLSETTAKMQDGLIITMADMVENRDSDTGAHIQKTAAYVKIIVEGLRKKGYYTEKITDKFISDVVRSAPLHDVGKISVPDGVLNKPGKLDEKEFEIMKTHTTEGRRIIEEAISTVEGENYLKEARNMAAYHHERWDGKGYPEGLHGEVIPLSARIMAVADVFDALTSPRIYKPAFPIEKALAIIEEGKGTQFDPKCVEVFMDSLTEVRLILKKYNQDA